MRKGSCTSTFRTWRWSGLILAGLLPVAALAGASSDPVSSRARFEQENPRVGFMMTGSQISTIYGPAFEYGSTAEHTAERFVSKNVGMFGVDLDSLVPHGPTADIGHTLGAMYRPETDDYKFTIDMVMDANVKASHYRQAWTGYESCEVVDDLCFIVRFDDAQFSAIDALVATRPVPEFIFAYDETGKRYPDARMGGLEGLYLIPVSRQLLGR